MSEVPSGWRRMELKNCGTWLSGGTPATEEPRFWDGDIPWISAASLKDFKINDSDRRVTRAGSMAGTKMVDAGSVLFVVRGMSLKSEFRVGVSQRRVAFGQDCKAILPHRGIDATFLGLALKARERDILAMVDEAGHGTGRLPSDLLANLEIDVPSELQEQRRIVEILDAVDGQIESLDRLLLKSGSRKWGLAEALLGRVDEREAPLADFLEGRPKNGYSPVEADGWTGMKSLGLGCLTTHGFKPAQLKNVDACSSRNPVAALSDGDLLMSRANTRELVGLVGIYRDIGIPCIYPDLMMKLTPAPSCVPEFLELVIQGSHARRQIKAQAQGTSESMVKISGSIVLGLRVRIPGIHCQRKIIHAVSTLKEEIARAQSERQKLMVSRSSLANDLLTGRVRV